MRVCPYCNGKKFKEYNAGLLQVECRFCSGSGELNDIDSGTEGIGEVTGSDHPVKPTKRRKSKTKKAARGTTG